MFDIGSRIVNLRTSHNLSANKLSKELRVDPSTINKIEKGTAKPSVDLLFNICNYFDITPAEFFDTTSADLSSDLLQWLEIGKDLTGEQRTSLLGAIKKLREF